MFEIMAEFVAATERPQPYKSNRLNNPDHRTARTNSRAK
jgi:hypothetical protein